MKNSKNSFGHKVLFSGLTWALVYLSCLLVNKKLHPGVELGILLSILPAACFAVFIYYYIKGIGSMDELESRIQLEASVIGFTLSLIMIMTLGLLDLVIQLNREDWGYRHLIPYFVIFYLVGLIVSKRKYHGNEKLD